MMENFKILTKEEAKEEMATKNFDDFLDKTGRIVERAIDSEFDIVGDFFIDDDNEAGEKKKTKGEKLTKNFVFQQTVQVKRAVTAMDWSPKHTELLLCSYSKCSEYRYDEPDGLVNIFSLARKNMPEKTLTC